MKKTLLLLTSFLLITTAVAQTNVVTGLNIPRGLAINGTDLYIVESDAGKILKIDLTANPPMATDVVTGLSGPYALALSGNDLYITELNANKISKIDITANLPTTATDAVTGLSSPAGLALNGDDLYITENESGILVKFDLSTLSLNDLTLDSKKLHVIPNPATERITISGLKNKERFGIYNLLGAEMLTGALIDNGEIEIKRFSNGLYFLKFNDGATLKFIKE